MPAGADWAREGWLLVRYREGGFSLALYPTFAELVAASEGDGILVADVPMGLPAEGTPGGRNADRAARELLPVKRRSTVFPTPSRRALAAGSLEEARRLNAPAGMNRQVFALLPLLREVDAVLTPELQERVYEGHPELSFFAAGGWPAVRDSKRTQAGRLARLEVLKKRLGPRWWAWYTELDLPRERLHDLLDASILLWTAARLERGKAGFVPEEPEYDARGLRMQIAY